MTQGNKSHTIQAVLCGAQKAGTTSLAYYLRQHPELDVPKKELHYFDNETIDWKSPNYGKYENNFQVEGKIRIDHTPSYMFWDPCCARIHKYNPDMKIIAILRNPSERAYSQWSMEHNRGKETLSFQSALEREINSQKSRIRQQHRIYSYIDRGMYCRQVKRLWHYFGKHNVWISKHDDLREKTLDTVQNIYRHLGVTTNHKFDSTKQRVGQYPTTTADAALAHLKELFHDEIEELEKLLDWDCSSWK